MVGLLDVLQTPQGLGMLLSGIASAGTGDQSYLHNQLAMQAQFQDLETKRTLLEEHKKRQQVMAQLPGLLESLTSGTMDDPQDLSVGASPPGSVMADIRRPMTAADASRMKGQVTGLLATIAPEETAKGLLGALFEKDSGRAAPSDIREMQMLGLPLTPDGFAKYNQLKAAGGKGNDQLDQLLKGLNIKKLLLDIGSATDKRDADKSDKEKDFALNQAAMTRNFERLKTLSSLAEGIRGTIVESGSLPELRRQVASGAGMLGRWAGYDTKKLEGDVSNAELLSKGLNALVGDTLTRFGNNISDSRQQLMQNASANPAMKADSIRELLGQIAETMQDQAVINGYDVDKKGLGDFITRMQTPLPPLQTNPVVNVPGAVSRTKDLIDEAAASAKGAAKDALGGARQSAGQLGARAADIARMTQDQIKQVDVNQLGGAELRALKKRMDELGLR